jgi:deaminated glutathione amidase
MTTRAMLSTTTTSPAKNKAAVAQLTSTSNKFSNLVSIARCASLAKQQGASMLFLPECFGFMGSSATETLENAEIIETAVPDNMSNSNQDNQQQYHHRRNDAAVNDILVSVVNSMNEANATANPSDHHDNGSISLMDGLRTIAQASNLWISGGGIHEYINGERVYNTHVILNERGELICKYRKVHLFDVSIPDRGISLQESKTTKAGDDLFVLCDSPIGMLGLTTCYDMRFPEQYTALVQRGAQILLMPSAFTVPTGQAHWHVLLRARAIETQCYVLAAAQVGRHNDKRESYGHAVAIDPWGVVMADAGGDGTLSNATVIVCDIDLEYLNNVRLRMPIQTHREAANIAAIVEADKQGKE